MKRLFLFINICLLATAAFAQQRAIPPQGGYLIHDDANVLSQQDKAMLEYLVKAEDDSTSNQIAVLIVPSLDGDEISSYANRVYNSWKLGTEKKDNGVLFLISVGDRRMRMEVGQGLEGVLTDVQASRIDRDRVAPYFRQGDYASGVKAGVVSIIQTIKGEYKNDQPRQHRQKKPFSWVSLLVILIIIIISSRRRGWR
ncbi:MAG: TPM domain-containing protein [Bacteroidota bacterium]